MYSRCCQYHCCVFLELFDPLNSSSSFFPFPSARKLLFYFVSEFAHSRYFMYVESYNICLFVPGLFHLACFQSSSMLCHVTEFHSVLRLNFYSRNYATFCLSIYWLMDICVGSTFWLLCLILLWIFICRYLFESLFSIILCVYLRVELLSQAVILKTFEEPSHCFFPVTVPVYMPSLAILKGFNFSASFLCIFFLLKKIITAMLMGLSVVLTCISLETEWCCASLEKLPFHTFACF